MSSGYGEAWSLPRNEKIMIPETRTQYFPRSVLKPASPPEVDWWGTALHCVPLEILKGGDAPKAPRSPAAKRPF